MKSEHIHIRLNATDKARLVVAAELEGRPLTEVVTTGTMREVEKIEKRKQTTEGKA